MPGIKRQTAIATINKSGHIITTAWTADRENAINLRFSVVTIERILCGGRDRFPRPVTQNVCGQQDVDVNVY